LLAKICSPRVLGTPPPPPPPRRGALLALLSTVAHTEIGDESSAWPAVCTGSRASPASRSSWKARYAGLATFCELPPASVVRREGLMMTSESRQPLRQQEI
jgi:hypothetical protein